MEFFCISHETFHCFTLVGYNIGVMNSPADFIKDWCNQTIFKRYDERLTHDQLETLWSTIISIFLVGGCVGSLFAATIADKFGRCVCVYTTKIFTIKYVTTLNKCLQLIFSYIFIKFDTF